MYICSRSCFHSDKRTTLDWGSYEHNEILEKFLRQAYGVADDDDLDCPPTSVILVASYNVRSYTFTARKFTRARSVLGDVGVSISFHKEGAKEFFPAVVDEMVEFRYAGRTHRLARVIPFSNSDLAIAEKTRIDRMHMNSTVTDPVTYARCTGRHMPHINDVTPIFVSVHRIFGFLRTLGVYERNDRKSKLVPHVIALSGYWPWYRPGETGIVREKMSIWNPGENVQPWML